MEPYYLETGLEKIKELALLREAENYRFKNFLKNRNVHKIDLLVQRLYNEVAPHIDCTTCGNCCRQLSPYLSKDDLKNLCQATGLPVENVISTYTETDEEGLSFKQLPCPFLAENKCSIYAHRPETCASFPHLHKTNFNSRLRRMIENYSICPIIFNVLEKLKTEMHFS